MSIYWDDARGAWRWQFKAVIDGRRHRSSKLLPRGWSEAQARRYDEAQTARTYARLASGQRTSTVPLIDRAVALYLQERVPQLRDGLKAAQNLAHLLPEYQGRPLSDLGAISRAYRPADLSPATVRQRLACLRAAATYALKKHGIGEMGWVEQMDLPAVSNERSYGPTRAEILRICRACPDRGTRALILLTFGTGSRPGECHRAQTDGARLIQDTKTGRKVKPVPERLRRYLRHWPLPHDYTWYAKRWRAARDAVGLSHLHQHDLRHGTASALLDAGHNLAEVGAVLDHASAQSTKRYAHMAQDRKAALLERLWTKRPHKRTA